MQLTWAICDQMGRVRNWLTERSNASVSLPLNAHRTATVTASIEDPVVQSIRPARSRLKVYATPESGNPDARYLLMNGLILQPKADGTSLEIPAVCPSQRLETSSPAPFPVGHPLTVDPLWAMFTDEQSQIMWEIIHRSDNRADGLTADEPDRPPVPELGILEGTLTDSGIYLARNPHDTQTTWDELTARAAMNRAPDFEFDPADRNDGVFAHFNTYWPRQGTDKRETLIFEYGYNVSEFGWEPSGAKLCNRLILVGLGKGKKAPVWVAENHASMRKYGVYTQIKSIPDTRNIATLQLRAEEYIARHAHLVNFIDLTPSVEAGGEAIGFRRDSEGNLDPILGSSFAIPPTFGPPGADFDYWLGDTITFRAKEQLRMPLDRLPGQPLSDVYARITQADLSEADEAGNVVVALTTAPEIHHANVSGYESEAVVDAQFSGLGDTGIGA